MTRRLPVAIAAVALTSIFASGCSTFSKNKDAARAAGSSLSVDAFESITADLAEAGQIAPATNGEFTGDTTRGVLTRWVFSHLLSAALDRAGTPIDAATRTAAEEALKTSAGENWATLHAATQRFLVDELAGENSFVSGPFISDAEAQAAYEAGLAASNTLCMRVIGFADVETATSVYQQLLDGADFATVADANNADPGAGSGGVYVNPTTNSECSSASALNEQVAQSLLQTPVGVAAPPFAITGSDGSQQFFVVMQRPWSEVATAAGPVVRQALGPAAARTLIRAGKAEIDSRYGMWDSTTLAVVPTR